MHLLLQRLLFLLQAAGIYVEEGGEATLTNSNVFENDAFPDYEYGLEFVSALHFEPSHRQFLRCSA